MFASVYRLLSRFAPPAAFEGFRLMRAHPWSVVLWVATYLAAWLGLGALIALSIGRAGVIGLQVRFDAAAAQPARIPEFILHFGWIPAGLLLLSLLVGVVLVSAIYRAVLAPGEFQVGYMRFGMDELRLFMVSLLTPLLIPGVPLAIAAPIATGAFMTAGPARWMGFVSLLALSVLTVWLMVRLMLVGPMTLDRGEHSIEDSWRMTRGRFWPLVRLCAASALLALVFGFVGTMIVDVAADILNQLRPRYHGHGINWGKLVLLLVKMLAPTIFGTLGWIVVAAPAAAVYRDLRAEPVNLGTASATT
jgi:hypothetical protein